MPTVRQWLCIWRWLTLLPLTDAFDLFLRSKNRWSILRRLCLGLSVWSDRTTISHRKDVHQTERRLRDRSGDERIVAQCSSCFFFAQRKIFYGAKLSWAPTERRLEPNCAMVSATLTSSDKLSIIHPRQRNVYRYLIEESMCSPLSVILNDV